MADDPQTAGMIALVPTVEDAERLAVQGGDDPDTLHLTLVYLGDDVTGWDDNQVDKLTADLDSATTALGGPLAARVMGHALFNPDGGPDGDMDPCAVYLVGDTSEVGPLRDSVLELLARHELPVAEQHTPFLPHVTGAYGVDTSVLSEPGPVTFDRLRIALGDQEIDVPLGEPLTELDDDYEPPTPIPVDEVEVKKSPAAAKDSSGTGTYTYNSPSAVDEVEVKGDVAANRRHKLAEQGHTLREEDENYPIGNLSDLDNAIQAWGRAKESDRPALKRHLLAEARRLNASKETTGRIRSLGSSSKELPLAGVETKVASPDPRAARLRAYWAHGKGLAKWFRGLGTPGNFRRLRRTLAKYVQGERILNGLTANIYHEATGTWPGRRRGNKALPAEVEFKSLWDDDPEVVADDGEQAMCEGIDEWGQEFLDRADDVADPDGEPDGEQTAAPVGSGVEEKAAPPVGLVTIPAADLPDLFPDDYLDDEPDDVDRLMLDVDAAILAADRLVADGDGNPDDEPWTEVAVRDRRYILGADAVLEPVDDDDDLRRNAPPAAVL